MIRRYQNELARLQKLPHKWWKKNINYVPAYHEVEVRVYIRELEWAMWDVRHHIYDIKELTNLKHISEFKPTPWDYIYAINVEILEWKVERTLLKSLRTSTPADEMADVAIMAALYIKTYFPEIDLYTELSKREPVRNQWFIIKPLTLATNHPTDEETLNKLLELIMWGLTGGRVSNKIKYNEGRQDHAPSKTDSR